MIHHSNCTTATALRVAVFNRGARRRQAEGLSPRH